MLLNKFHQQTENQFKNSDLEILSLNKYELLFNQGDEMNFMYFILEGELNIIKNKQMVWQAFMQEFIGLTSFFTSENQYSYSVKACKKSTVVKVSKEKFNTAINNSNTLNANLLKLFCSRIKLTQLKTKSYCGISKKKKIISLLINKTKTSILDQKLFDYSILDISEFINIPPKFVKKILLELQVKKLIRIKKQTIDILDYNGLKLVLQMKLI